jgi:Nitrile hydratase, alpha chain
MGTIQDLGYELPRIPIPRTPVNKPCVIRDGLPGRAQRTHNISYKLGGTRAKGEQIMTEASGGGGRAEMERRLVQRSLEDDSFRQRLLDDPKGTVEQELGSRLAESTEVRVVEESADTIYLVLPSASVVGEGGELSDEALESVAGGDVINVQETDICQDYGGVHT